MESCSREHDPSNNYLLHVIQKVKYSPKGGASKGAREAATRTSSDVHHGSLWGLNCLKGNTLENFADRNQASYRNDRGANILL